MPRSPPVRSRRTIAESFIQLRVTLASVAVLAVASLALSTWVFRQTLPSTMPLIIAHRTGAADGPENSLAALRKVLKDGVTDIVEIDVTLTRDGELVVAHDADLMKQAGDPLLAARVLKKVHSLSPSTRVLLRYRRFWGVFNEMGWWQNEDATR